MIIKNLFLQDVNREIETVVKADDTRNRDTEIKEYVITNEISRKIGNLFSEYGRSTTINGVWIHGFFGSGKSHLLKMLSYVFGGVKLESGVSAAEVFSTKTNDELLKSDILRAGNVSAESILFNIDQQATISSKEKGDSILAVFYKVFFDHLGFYGTQTHVAEFEWWLHFRKNIYTEFQEQFQLATGKIWKEARRDYYDLDITDAISAVLGKLLEREETDYETILEDIEEKQELSVQDFANRVAEYIKSKPKGFQLNFFIDEVGQFIAGDVNLMLNLQTITESLGTATGNKSWVFATAQSAIEGLGDDIKRTQDYSKILGRFRMQINLTSANVDEVIEKRLLEKKDEVVPELKEVYNKEKSLINAIISSSGKGMPIAAYKDENDFVCKYPFLFYQFSLFQECRISLANHDVFQGKHASVGERSMLGVFQEVLKGIEQEGVLTIVSFDKMYNGIQNDLRAEFVNSINNAEGNLGDDFAVKVFKTLFLVKYYKQFLATKENVAMLLIDHIHIDLKAHQEKVTKALTKLETHSYIERNGELYEFLTNKEKDIETEIKNTNIEESEVNGLLKEIFFDEIIGRNRIRFQDNKQEYEFTQKLDGGIFGKEKELAIEIITPNYGNLENLENLKAQTMGLPLLRLVTEPDSEFMGDVRMLLKVKRYHNLNQSSANNSEARSILNQKMSDNNKRRASIKNRADEILGRAKAFVNGAALDILPKTSGQNYVNECFQDLIKTTYPNLRMLGASTYTEDTFKRIIQGFGVPEIFEKGDASVSEAENQILIQIERRKNQSERTSIYDLRYYFSKKPHGWYDNATFSLIAKLFIKNKIEVAIGENPLDDNQLINALLNSSQHTRAYILSQTVYSGRQIQVIKELYKDLFDQNTVYNDAKDIGQDFKDKLKELTRDVQGLLAQKTDFPFVERLQTFHDNIRQWANRSYKDIIESVKELEESLLDTKEDDYDPIKTFIKGTQANIYKNIATMVNGNTANIDYVEGDEFARLQVFLKNEKPYTGDALQKAEADRKSLQEKILSQIDKERELTKIAVEKELKALKEHPEMIKLSAEDFEKLTRRISAILNDIPNQRFIGNLRADRTGLSALVEMVLNQAVELNRPQDDSADASTAAEPQVRYINKSQVRIPFKKQELSTEEDVKDYVKALEETFLKEIKENRRIRL